MGFDDEPESFLGIESEQQSSVHRPLSSRRGTTKSALADKDQFLKLIKESRGLIQDLNQIEEEMEEATNEPKSFNLMLMTDPGSQSE